MTIEHYTIYDHPSDFPNYIVVRRRIVISTTAIVVDPRVWAFESVDDARQWLPHGLACIPRDPLDDPVIIETWM